MLMNFIEILTEMKGKGQVGDIKVSDAVLCALTWSLKPD